MAPASVKPLCLVHGEDDFAVKERARALYKEWCTELGGMDHEIIDAAVGNAGDALRVVGRLREALNTLPFFGGAKAIWLQDCSFIGDDRTSASETVTSTLSELAGELTRFDWRGVRLLISAGRVDKRRSFYKAIDKTGAIEHFASLGDMDGWPAQAEGMIREALAARGKEIADDAVDALIAAVGPSRRHLMAEVEKASLYAGDRARLVRSDVEAVVSRHKQAEPFALIEAVSRRNLAGALRCLDEELWEMQSDKKKSEFGLLAVLTSRFRSMIVVSELIRLKYLRPGSDARACTGLAQRVPAGLLPEDKRYNPASMHPFALSKVVDACGNYTSEELIRAMELLLACNRKLLSSGPDERLVLQQTLVDIIGRDTPGARRSGRAGASAGSGMGTR